MDVKNFKRYYEMVAEMYVVYFASMYEFDLRDIDWVADDVGGVLCCGDYFFGYDDVRYCVDNQLKWEVLIGYYDYAIINKNRINLKNYAKKVQ